MVGKAPQWSHEATFQASPISASQARSFVTRRLVEHRLLYLVDRVRLVTSELATKVLVHARTGFTVTLEGLDDTVLLTVREHSHALRARSNAKAMDPTAGGFEIVALISHEWGIDQDPDGSRAVWATFALRSARDF